MVLADDGIRVPLAEAGIEIVEPEQGAGSVSAVMVGYTRNLTSDALEAIIGAVWDGAEPFASPVAPHGASSRGKIVGIPGAVSAAIEHCSGVRPTVMGKPSTAGMDTACGLTRVPAGETALIGDNPKLENTIGRRAGALTIGVTTDAYDLAPFESRPEAERAHVVLDALSGFAGQPWIGEN